MPSTIIICLNLPGEPWSYPSAQSLLGQEVLLYLTLHDIRTFYSFLLVEQQHSVGGIAQVHPHAGHEARLRAWRVATGYHIRMSATQSQQQKVTGEAHRLVLAQVRDHRESGAVEACCGRLALRHLVASDPAASLMRLFPPAALGVVGPERVVPPSVGHSMTAPF